MTAIEVSAYVPCFNGAATLADVLRSIGSQTVVPSQVIVIDDGSTDGSRAIAERLGASLVVMPRNLGRGAARARAVREARGDLILSCDATNVLAADFLERAIPWFDSPEIGAVFGQIAQPQPRGVAERWRARHLFKLGRPPTALVQRRASLATGASLVRKAAVLAVGNFDEGLRYGEDQELGNRLLDLGWDVVCDRNLAFTSIARDTVAQVLERYWRWNMTTDAAPSWHSYLRQVVYSATAMAIQDVRAADLLAVPISLMSPHYQFWRTMFDRWRQLRQRPAQLD